MNVLDNDHEAELGYALLERRGPALTGTLIGCIALLFLTLFGWLAWARVDEVVHATGTVEPAGRVKVVNHPHGGRVAEIHVREGQGVRAGDLLLSLDGEVARSERSELAGRLEQRKVEVARLEAEAAGRDMALVDADLRPDLLAAQQALLAARDAAIADRREALARSLEARRGELRTARAEVERLRASLELLKRQRDAVRELADRGLYPELKVVQLERQYSDDQGELAKAKASRETAEAAVAEAASRVAGLETERRSDVLGQLAQAKADRDRLGEQLRAQEAILAGLEVRAPADGVVEEIAVTAAGQAVAPHEALMKLVPRGEGLVVEAKVANQDVGRLRRGMPATVKVRAFDYLRFGTLEGVLDQIAADATPDARTGELTYAVRVLTGTGGREGESGALEVGPGMLVDVDLKVGDRTILSYLTDRIFRLREAFRES